MNSSYLYTGNPIVPDFEFKLGDKPLIKDVDYDMEITDNVNVGTAHIYIKGKGKFTGEIEQTFEIEPVQAKTLSFYADNTEFEYNGEPKTMLIAVKFGETTLTEGSDYDVVYTNNVNPGKAVARLNFKGNFSGAMNIPFTIRKAFINTSVLYPECVVYKETLTVESSSTGGAEPYTYAYYIKRGGSDKWIRLADYSAQSVLEYTPNYITDYELKVKIKDSNGHISEKTLSFTVKANLDLRCTLSSDEIKKSSVIRVTAETDSDAQDLNFRYYIRKTGEKKWITIDKGINKKEAQYKLRDRGEFEICVKADNDTLHSKQYLKLRSV